MVNHVIYSRKAAIDQFVEGLCALRFFELITTFPDALEPLFVSAVATIPRTDDLLGMLQLSSDCCSESDQQTFSMLKEFIRSLNSASQLTI